MPDDLAIAHPLSFRLLGWSAWTESMAMPQALADTLSKKWVPATGYTQPGTVPMMLRRRASALGRHALGAAMALPEIATSRFILSSRHGELSRTTSIMSSLAGAEPVSPADFSMSVHHGLVGLLSIATKNTQGHSAVSAGPESFCYGMLEAASCIADCPGDTVIQLHYDERPEGVFGELFTDVGIEGPIAAALSLGSAAGNDGVPLTLEFSARRDGDKSNNHALDFLLFILTGANNLVSHGNRLTWEWTRG